MPFPKLFSFTYYSYEEVYQYRRVLGSSTMKTKPFYYINKKDLIEYLENECKDFVTCYPTKYAAKHKHLRSKYKDYKDSLLIKENFNELNDHDYKHQKTLSVLINSIRNSGGIFTVVSY